MNRPKLRRCKFERWDKDKRAYVEESGYFHAWGVDYEEFGIGPGNFSIAIVEDETGVVWKAVIDKVKFEVEVEDEKRWFSVGEFVDSIGYGDGLSKLGDWCACRNCASVRECRISEGPHDRCLEFINADRACDRCNHYGGKSELSTDRCRRCLDGFNNPEFVAGSCEKDAGLGDAVPFVPVRVEAEPVHAQSVRMDDVNVFQSGNVTRIFGTFSIGESEESKES